MYRSSGLFPFQYLLILFCGALIAVGWQWVGLPFCLSTDSLLRLVVFLSCAYVIRVVVSPKIFVGRATHCLPCSSGMGDGLTEWAGLLQGMLHNGKGYRLTAVASLPVAEPSCAQQ